MRNTHVRRFVALALALTGQAFAGPNPSTQPAHAVEARMKTPATFKAQPTRLLADLPGFTSTSMPEHTAFGGVTRYPKSKATGFFRTEKIDGRWWLIDPQGCRMINAAVASTNFGQMGPDAKQAYEQKFGSPTGWAERTRQFLRDNNFDGTGNWSDDTTLSAGTDHPLVRTSEVSFMGAYAGQRGGTHAEPGHLGYPNKCIFVFDPQFAAFADTAAAQMAPAKDDPYLLGWFTDNELPFPLEALDQYLTLPNGDPGRTAADAFLAQRHLEPRSITDTDRQAFTAIVAEKYFGIVHDAIRKVDANHLILGPRFHATDHRNPALLAAAGKYTDAIGYNMYGVWTPDEVLQRITKLSGRPVLITEFYAKAEDSGMGNTDGGGWLVHTQSDRAAFYQNFTLGLIQSRVCVGWQWFKYIDNDPSFAKGSTPSDSNKGVLNRLYEPYLPLVTALKQLNANRYALADYFDRSK